jgi:hypothetical protein
MSTHRRLAFLAALAILGLAPSARAQGVDGILPTPDNPPTRQGTRGANFLHLPIGAQGNAMGGAINGIVSGPTAWFWNPAGGAIAEGFSAAAGRQDLYGDLGLGQTYAALSLPALGGVVGLSYNGLNSGDIFRTSEEDPLGNDAQAGRTFQWNSTAVSLGYARRLTERLSVGAQMKYITEGISDATSTWVAADIGTQFNTGIYGLVVSGAIMNVGGQARAEGPAVARVVNTDFFLPQSTRVDLFTRKTDLPTFLRTSLGIDVIGSANSALGQRGGTHKLYAEANVTDGVDIATQLGVGAEYGFKNTLFLRAGKRFYNDDREADEGFAYGMSVGAGFRFDVAGRNVRFDYSFTNVGELQDIQVFSFEVIR